MSKTVGPMAAAATWDSIAETYTQHVMPVFENFAREALRISAVPPNSEILDVAAGPGTLALMAAEQGHTVTAIDLSRGMIDRIRAASSARKLRLDAKVGDGMALELPGDKFHAAFSMFGMMFFPSRARGFSELYRVLRPGGRAVVASWAPLDQIPLLALTLGTLAELVPVPAKAPGRALETPEACVTEMATAGFSDVTVERATFAFESPTLKELWSWYPSTIAPLVAISKQQGEGFPAVLEKVYARLEERFGPGPVKVDMPALLTVGTKN